VALITVDAPSGRAGLAAALAADVTEVTGTEVVGVAVDRHRLGALRHLDRPVLVVGPRCQADRCGLPLSGELLACVDGSPRAETVLPVASVWADSLGLDLWLLYVLSLADAAELARHPGPADVLQNGYLARVVAELDGPAAVAGWEVLHGSPAASVVAHARHCGAGLIALNSHGASSGARVPLGRVPARIVAESPVPVLLTHTTEAPVRPAASPRTRPRPSYAPRRTRDLSQSLADGDSVSEAARSFLLVSGIRQVPARTRPRRRPRSRRATVAASALMLAVLAGFAARVPPPYHRLDGTTRPAAGLVTITGLPVDPHAGTFLVTVVTAEQVTLGGVVRSWFDRSDVERDAPSGPAADNLRWVNQRLMDESGQAATTVAFGYLGLDPSAARVAIVPHGLGGPSAGLAMALEMVDLLSPGDLTDGRLVAVSGALDEQGRIGPVGGIRYKAEAARHADADLLLVPPGAYVEAQAHAEGVRVVPVATFGEALAALRSELIR
jgi:PDZ domain-containing protein